MTPSAMTRSYLLACDRQQSVLYAQAAQRREARVYSVYGHRQGMGGSPGFNGELPERATGHYLLGNGYRAYNPVLMRFNSPDSWSPFGRGGLNAYAYCVGDPVNRSDPTGHFSWQEALAMGIGVIGIGMSLPSMGTMTPLAMLSFSLGSVSEVATAVSISNGGDEGGNKLWVAGLALGATSVVAGVVGWFSRVRETVETAQQALTRNPVPRPSSPPRELIERDLSRVSDPSPFTKALLTTNANLGSHGNTSLTPKHAQKYVDLANAVDSGSISNTTAHGHAAIRWVKNGGPNGMVGGFFNALAALVSGGVDAALRNTGRTIRRGSGGVIR